MAKRDYYEILGLKKGAKEQEIKSAYRKLAKKYHPDSNPNDKKAEQYFKEVTEAYNVLSDAEKRRLYDQYGHAAFDGSMGSDPDAFAKEQERYRSFYQNAQRGQNAWRTGAKNAWDTGAQNGTHWYEFRGNGGAEEDIFSSIFGHGGRGFDNDAFEDYVYDMPGNHDLMGEITITFREAALGCEKVISLGEGSGPALAVKIPAGIEEGQSIRLAGKGNASRNGKKGDLFIKIHVLADQFFTRKGRDVYVTEKVPYTTAILGGEAEFQTLYGRVKCKVPAGSQSGTKIRLGGKGIASARGKGGNGDEYVTLEISVPKQVSEKEKELLRQLHSLSGRTA
ncbi:MAG: J domain-containing protein [Lachnospiraceae bacterium]|nr:J domain-containing protein [Lachnospiraceae bacterium]MBR4606600.1 J domain-containing protein [Lachnospiraceae bacterium]